MENLVGLRFLPTDEEIMDHYLRLKNLGGSTSHIDQVISTVNICDFDPWDLPPQSRIESRNQVWYFFGRKERKYNRGERHKRKTKSGFWKKTGVTLDIKRKRGNSEKIGEKRVLVFYTSVTLDITLLACLLISVTYTICKIQFKGEATEISSSRRIEIVEHTHSLTTPINNLGGGLSLGSEELQNPPQLSCFLDKHQETLLEEAIQRAFDNLSSYDWYSLLDDGDDKQSQIVSMQNSLTGVFIGHREQ